MEFINANLASIWLVLIGFFLLYYVLSDGADLGIGILTLFTTNRQEKETMMHAIHTIWHANQTWLVILGGMLFGAFPLFYSIVLSALYIPFIIMLFGMIFRGVAFEFHGNAERKGIWLFSFGFGSLLTSLGQGFALGGLLGGIHVQQDSFAGSPGDWINWYSAIATAGVVFGYLMLGSALLIVKTSGRLQEKSYRAARLFGILTLVVTAVIYIGTSLLHEQMMLKWTAWPPSLLYVFCALTLGSFVMYFRSLEGRSPGGNRQITPLVWNWLLIAFSFVGLSIGFYPGMIPRVGSAALTVREVAASDTTLQFMLVVMVVLLPVILAYTTYTYWIFRGKADGEEGYG